MKQVLFLALLNCIAFTLVAQQDKDETLIAQLVFGQMKKAVVKQYVSIGKKDSAAFWKLYNEYEAHCRDISAERYQLLNEYAQNYFSLTEVTASRLAERLFSNAARANQLYKLYFRKFKKSFGAITAAALFQVEIYIHTAIEAGLQAQIPIIGQIGKVQMNTQ